MKRLILMILIISILVGCGGGPDDIKYRQIDSKDISSIEATPGGSVKLPLTNFDTMHPLFSRNESIYQLNNLVYESLFNYTAEGSIEVGLAEHYQISPDGLILSITLRDDVYFHDGQKLTSGDVMYTFDLLMDSEYYSPYHNSIRQSLGPSHEKDFVTKDFMEMEIFDDRNIDIYFKEPYRDYLSLMIFPILCAEDDFYIEDAENYDKELLDYLPNGTGPYLVNKVDEDRVQLSINDNFHGRLPYIHNIIGEVYNDSELANLGFEIGDIDLYNFSSYDWNKYIDDQNINIEEYLSNKMDILYFNSRSGVFSGSNGKIIKEAISKSINKKRIIDRVYIGHAKESILPINKKIEDQLKVKGETYLNIDEAKELLLSLGYDLDDNTGLMKNQTGDTIDVNIITNQTDPVKRTIVNFLIEDLKSIGVNAKTKDETENLTNLSQEAKEEYEENHLDKVRSGAFDMALVSVNITEVPNPGTFVHSSSIGNGLNFSYYSSVEMDVLLDKLKTSNQGDIDEIYQDIIEIMSKDVPVLPICTRKSALLIGPKIQGELRPFSGNIYNKVRDSFILKGDQ